VTSFIRDERLQLLTPLCSPIEHPDLEPSVLTGEPGRARVHAREVLVTMSAVAKNRQCAASLRNGAQCRMVVETEGAEFCPYHLRLVGSTVPS
jgi:hypothetical protein